MFYFFFFYFIIFPLEDQQPPAPPLPLPCETFEVMEEAKRNGTYGENMWQHEVPAEIVVTPPTVGLSKREKRRQQISSRLNKVEVTFHNDRDNIYKLLLQKLQNTLATLQQGTNEEYTERKTDLEEVRDYELTRLRLWEEYQVKRIETEYNEDISKAKTNHDKMIRLIKEKLYDKLGRQVKQLKDDKLLLNLVNANSWKSGDKGSSANGGLIQTLSISLHERRSLRKRDASLRFGGDADDYSDDGVHGRFPGHGSSGGGGGGSGSGYFLANGANGKRRRHYTTRYSSNDESLVAHGHDGGASASGYSSSHNHRSYVHGGSVSSGYDSNLSDKDYDALNSLIMGNKDGGVLLVLRSGVGDGGVSDGAGASTTASHARPTRGSSKQFTGLAGLRPEELSDDLALLRTAIKKV